MAQLFGKNEMILLALTITMLDINNLCNYALPHILYPNKRSYLIYATVLGTLIIDIYMYYTQINENIIPENRYKVEQTNDGTQGCPAYIKNLENQIVDWKDVCANKQDGHFRATTTKTMLSILAFFLIGISLLCFSINKEGTNTVTFKAIFVIPFILIAVLLLIYGFSDVTRIFANRVSVPTK